MRFFFSFSSFVAFVLIACSSEPPGPLIVDAGARTDAGRRDGGGLDAGAGATDAGRDASSPDAGPPDSGRADAGPPDAGAPDAGPPGPGDDCATAIDVDRGGHFTGTTCGASDTVTASCNAAGTPDRIFFVHGVDRLAAYNFILGGSDFVFYFVTPSGASCTASGDACLGSSSVLARSPAYFAVERRGGGCGEFDLEIVPPP